MSHTAANVPYDPADLVSIPRAQLDRLKSQYRQLLDEKVQMEADISVLMHVGRKLMSIFQGKNIIATATQLMRNPTAHKQEFVHLEALYVKYAHLMPADGSQLLPAGNHVVATLEDGN